MPFFTETELKQLLEINEHPCVSIYLPTHKFGAETQQDPIRLKNMLGKAESRLGAMGLDHEMIKSQLKNAWQLVEQYEFWQYQDNGLALFITPTQQFLYQVPIQLEEQVFVSNQINVKPLLPLLQNNGHFYILAVSQNKTRFFQATRDKIETIELESMPSSLAEALQYDDPEKQLQYHSATSNSAMYHGQGGAAADRQANLLRYFQSIDTEVCSWLKDSQAPLVFMGVDYLFPIYQQATHYGFLCQESIAMNPDQIHPHEIHQKAWPIVESLFKQSMEKAIATYRNQKSTPLTTTDLQDVLVAAHDGQIETLFIPTGCQIWGHFDAQKREMTVDSESTGDNQELLNLAATYTLFCQGQVYAIEPEDIPGGVVAAAILRYPMVSLIS